MCFGEGQGVATKLRNLLDSRLSLWTAVVSIARSLASLEKPRELKEWVQELNRTILVVGGPIEELPETEFILREESSELDVLTRLLVRKKVTRRSECGMNSVILICWASCLVIMTQSCIFCLAAKMGINSCTPPVRFLSSDYSFQRESFTACHSRLMKEFHAEHLAGCLPCTAEEAFAINAKVSNWHFYKNRQSSPLSNWCLQIMVTEGVNVNAHSCVPLIGWLSNLGLEYSLHRGLNSFIFDPFIYKKKNLNLFI